jgi:hypothetical protein
MADAAILAAKKQKPIPKAPTWYCPEHEFVVLELEIV